MSPRPGPPPDLAGRWLGKFFTDYLVGERAASPRTVAAYRDAMKLLLTWFRNCQRIPPERLRLADIDRPRVLRFLDWLQELVVERHRKAATVVTSNREPAEWMSMMSDTLLAQSAIDRLTSGAHTLVIEGPSYRQRNRRNQRAAIDTQSEAL